MSRRRSGVPWRVSRSHRRHALRVAAAAAAAVVVVGVGAVLGVNEFVSHRLTSQVSDQVHASLAAAVRDPARALNAPRGTPEFQDPGGRYGLGIYGSPILFWQVSGGRVARSSAGAPPLPRADRDLDTSTVRIGSVPFLVAGRADKSGVLVAGESLSELEHVRSVLELAELLALPLLALVAFLGALAIGIRSVVPVEEARRRQLEFTADASHELRTPLSVIEAELALAGNGSGNAPLPATLARVQAESRRLTTIVEDLLFLARFDSEPSPPSREPIDLGTTAAECAERFTAVAGAKSLELSVNVPLGAPASPLVSAPAEWLDRLVGVLMDNACKYARPGGAVRIEASANGGRAMLRVEDSGPGIPPDQRQHLFDRFRRLDDSRPGHGLGLAIADSIVRSTGGRWRIGTSDLGGALMEVSWPLYLSRK